MSDENLGNEEHQLLRQTLHALLEDAGVLYPARKVFLHQAHTSQRGYLLTASSEAAPVLAARLVELAGVKNSGPVWIILASEAVQIVQAWRALAQSKTR